MSSGFKSATGLPFLSRTTRSDRKSTRLNSSHLVISYAVFCLKKKKKKKIQKEFKKTRTNLSHQIPYQITITHCLCCLVSSWFLCIGIHFFVFFFFFFFNDTATTEIYTLSLHDALPI